MANINGTAGADNLTGTGQNDVIRSDSGPDTLNGGKGNDIIHAGGGHDVAKGASGDDVIYGFSDADVAPSSGSITVTRITDQLDLPVFAMSAPGAPNHLFVVEKDTGDIEILNLANGALADTPFLNIDQTTISTGGEQGLLGFAFAPDYAESGKVYVDLTNGAGDLEIREYTRDEANPNQVDPDSMRIILQIPHPVEDNHNGGWIGFGPDDMLYITTGDGGGGGDPGNDAQRLDSLLGKVLRIDPSGDDFAGNDLRNYAIPDGNPFAGAGDGEADEIWHYGLRNPFRMSFDRETGDMWIGDVGQNQWEEIDFAEAGVGGINFGWNVMEGDHVFNDDTPGNPEPGDPVLVGPLVEYEHISGPFGGNVVTGGYVYRGPGGGQGLYFFADFGSDNLWTVVQADGEGVDFINRNSQLVGPNAGQFRNISSFAEDADGNLYGLGLGGVLFRIDPSEAAGDGSDKLSGGDGNDKVYGGVGVDKLAGNVGNDSLFGGLDNDRLTGGAGRDTLRGDAGADFFIFVALTDSLSTGSDRIVDLTDFDTIDLRRIDADSTQGGDQAFVLVNHFSGEAGELFLRYQASSDRTILRADVDGDRTADLTVTISGDHADFTGFAL